MTASGDTEFIDITGGDFANAPLVSGDVRAVYFTGSGSVPETQAQLAAMRADGMGVIGIDQTPSLTLFAEGGADVADIENYAGTIASAVAACRQRQAKGLHSVFYVSFGELAALQGALVAAGLNMALVFFWVADWSWSLAEAEGLLGQHVDWVAIQFGDPASNPNTLVPGTSVTLRQSNADIDVAKTSWTNLFLGALNPPAPAPAPAPSPAPTDPTEAIVQQLPVVKLGDKGPAVGRVQALLLADNASVNLGTTGPHRDGIDEDCGSLTVAAIEAFQVAHGLTKDGVVGTQQTWPALLGV